MINASPEIIPDDRAIIAEGDPVLLIIEDDPHYARVLLGLARDKGFKGLIATRGNIGLDLAREYKPAAITLDIFLPDMLGWTVLNNLKRDAATRHIPVQIISLEEEQRHGLAHGAFSYMVKPVTTEGIEQCLERIHSFITPRVKRLLVIEDNQAESQSIVELLAHDDIEIVVAGTASAALEALGSGAFDCCVLDLRLPDMSGFELLENIKADPRLEHLPVVVFTGKDLGAEEERSLKTMAKSIVLKDVQSPERLFDETALFLHRIINQLPEAKQKMLERLHSSNEVLHGHKVLVVDDDARNIFALSTVLENHDMQVMSATNGRQAIELLQSNARRQRGVDGHHDAGNGRLRNHARDSQTRRVPLDADPRAHRQGDEGRPGKMSRSRRLGLRRQAGQHRTALVDAAAVAV